MSWFKPGQVTERFAGQASFSDCGPCSSVMLARAHRGNNAIPGDKAEVLAFRQAAGAPATGATSNTQLARGLYVRYQVSVSTQFRFPYIWAALDPGMGAVLFGYLSRFPAGHRLRRWDPTYRGGHVVFVERLDAENRAWWMDPLAPLKYGTSLRTYLGEWVTAAELSTFLGGPNATTGRTGLITSVAVYVPPVTTYKLNIAAGTAAVHSATLSRGCIASWNDVPHDGSAASYACGAPVRTPGCISGSAVLAIPSTGPFAGRRLRINAAEGTSVT